MSSSGAIESSTPISGGCDDGGGTTSSVTDSPMRDEAVDSSPFQEGERVLAFHGPCLYDAKVLSFFFSSLKTLTTLLKSKVFLLIVFCIHQNILFGALIPNLISTG